MTHIRHILRTAVWAICKLFFILYIINAPFVVINPLFNPIGPTLAWKLILAWILILAPIAVLARRAYIRLEQ